MNIRTNKKAQAGAVTAYIPRLVFTVIVLIVLILLVNRLITEQANVSPAEAMTFTNNVLYSPAGLSYENPLTGRTVHGLIDERRINATHLNQSFNIPDNTFLAAHIQLFDAQNALVTETYYNEFWFNRWEPLARAFMGTQFFSGINSFTYNVPVQRYTATSTILDEKTLLPGKLTITILIPKT